MLANKKTIHTSEYRKLIDKLIIARKKANLTQKDVAENLHCSQSYISKIENYQIKIDPIKLQQFSKIYQVDISDLFN